MANYYTRFSVLLPLSNKEAQQHACELAHAAFNGNQGDALPADFPEALKDKLENWQFEVETREAGGNIGIWLHSENGGVDAACVFIQYLLQKYHPNEVVAFEWANDCDRPKLDAYAGGAAIITASEIKIMHTSQWIHEQLKERTSVVLNPT